MIRSLSVFLTALSVVAPLGASAGEITPHRAIYQIDFGDAKPESRLVGADGKWLIEISGAACTGYDISYRFVTQLNYEGRRTDTLDTRGSSFESGAGEAFNFSNKTFHNNRVIEDVKGIASRRDDALTIRLSRPETEEITLKNEPLFPSQHFLKLIEEAKQGNRFVESIVYEGTEGAKEPFAVSAIIGAERSSEREEDVEQETKRPYNVLEEKKLRSWPVSLSYFKTTTTGDALPEWQNSFILYENGISRDFVFDYGDFSLKAEMTSLELLPAEDCS